MTHVLHALGAAVLPHTANPGHGNPLGHWEPRALGAINDRILCSIGRPCDDPRPMPERWFRSREAYAFQRQITGEIRRGYGEAPLIPMKDPQLCRPPGTRSATGWMATMRPRGTASTRSAPRYGRWTALHAGFQPHVPAP